MSNPATYSWQQVYLTAVLETDNDLMPLRIYEALAAIEQRLLSPMDANEQRTIDDAQTGLLTLKAERIAEGKHVIHEGQLSKETC
jgi:7,8-dihydro-6-hydroxymethylpterin-pyrophosphokinase